MEKTTPATKPKMANPHKERIRRVAKRVLEGKGKVSVGAAMREEGYPPATVKNPQQLTQSKTWAEIMEECLPETDVGRVHKELLGAASLQEHKFGPEVKDEQIKAFIDQIPGCKLVGIHDVKEEVSLDADLDEDGELIDRPADVKRRIAYYTSPDNRTRKDALDMAYKLRGSYAAEKHANLNLNFSLADLRKSREAAEQAQ